MSLPISGFTAVPNPMMLSFLATQGFAIMYYGGAGWQFGKRKVSGMSNEEVNAMTPNDFLQKLHGETRTMVPTMAQGMKDMTPLISTTIEQFGSYIREAIKAFPQALQNIVTQPSSNLTAIAGGGAHAQGLSFAQIQMQQYLNLEASKHAGSHQDIKSYEDALTADTSGMTLAQHEFNKSEKIRLQLIKDAQLQDARNKRAILVAKEAKNFQTPTAQISTRDIQIIKRKAGQSAIMERQRLIRNIASYSRKPDTSVWRKILRAEQQKLVNLLARYRF